MRRALISGSVASVVSTAVISLLSRRHARHLAAGTNATSHWVWGEPATRRQSPSMRHTALGYAIHHASSIFWAIAYEHALRGRSGPARICTTAAVVSTTAYVVDYHVVPKRLTPGFEHHLPPRAMAASYAAFAAGLAIGSWLMARRSR